MKQKQQKQQPIAKEAKTSHNKSKQKLNRQRGEHSGWTGMVPKH